MNKRHYMIACMLLAAAASVQALPIKRAEARQVAQQLVGIDDHTPDGDEIEPFYVFSRGEGRGFVIVSGDDTTAPILGYTEQGDYAPESMPEPLRQMLDNWATALKHVQQQRQTTVPSRRAPQRRAIAPFKKDWESVPALVKTH